MFLGLRKLGNICCGHKMFLNKIRNIFCVRIKLRGQTGKHLCRQQCVRNNVSSFARALIDLLQHLDTWYKITHAGTQVACSGTFKTKQLVPVHLDLPLFWKFHCATCIPACVILHHVTESCKGPITGVFQAFSKLARSAKNGGRRKKGRSAVHQAYLTFFRFSAFLCCAQPNCTLGRG